MKNYNDLLKIYVLNNELNIKITAKDLKFVMEERQDVKYKITDENKFLVDFMNELQSDITYSSLTPLQNLFDKVCDQVYEDGSDHIEILL